MAFSCCAEASKITCEVAQLVKAWDRGQAFLLPPLSCFVSFGLIFWILWASVYHPVSTKPYACLLMTVPH